MSFVSLARQLCAAAFIATISAALLTGCETLTPPGKKIDYKSAGTAPALEIPPDLTTPTYDERYQTATASGVAAARAAGRPSELLPANPEARLVRAGSERWLVVKTSPEAAWSTLREFWTQNGFVVAVEQPTLGIMETDWAENRANAPQDIVQKYVGKYAAILTDTYKRDKFRSRIERGAEPDTVEIYVSHRGAEQVPTARIDNSSPAGFVWAPSRPNPELEAEFLERLLVKFGTPATTAVAAVSGGAKEPERARIEKSVNGSSQLVVDDAFDRAWRRVGLALDRTGFTVVDRDRSKGLYFVRYADPDLSPRKDSGFLSKLQFWKTDTKEKPEQYRVVVTQADPRSLVTVQDPAGAPDRSANSEKILSLLKDQLK